MKKAPFMLFAALSAFICLLAGIAIGRHSNVGMIMISDNDGIAKPDIYISADIASTVTTTNDDSGLININTASASVIQTLPNIGPVLAQRIVDFRTSNGDYTAPEDLLQVEGIGEKRLEQIRIYITTGG